MRQDACFLKFSHSGGSVIIAVIRRSGASIATMSLGSMAVVRQTRVGRPALLTSILDSVAINSNRFKNRTTLRSEGLETPLFCCSKI